MFKIFTNNGAVKQFQMTKEVSKVAARKILKEKSGQEAEKAASAWYQQRVDWKEAAKNAKQYQRDYERTLPETLSPEAKNEMWKKAKQLKDEFVIGMLSKEEMHPVKGFTEHGTMKYVVDEEAMRTGRCVELEQAWAKKNEGKIAEFKNIMRHLEPDDPRAGDVERYRPRRGVA